MTEHIKNLLNLIDRFDDFGQLDRKLPLFAVAIGTLRKDRDLAEDIFNLLQTDTSGLGVTALSRILIEDYFHLRFLNSNPDEIDKNLSLFNSHPYIDHYASMQSMKTWGYRFTADEAAIMPNIKAGFEAYKDTSLRPGKEHEPYAQDNYYRTWTKLTLDSLIKNSDYAEEDKSTLHFLNETYNTGSTIIHHNAFIIWFLATQGRNTALTNSGYNENAIQVTFIVLNRLFNLVLNIYGEGTENQETAQEFMLDLERILESFNSSREK